MSRGIGRGRGAPINQEAVRQSALFGWCSDLGQLSIVPGSNKFQLSLRFTEAPD